MCLFLIATIRFVLILLHVCFVDALVDTNFAKPDEITLSNRWLPSPTQPFAFTLLIIDVACLGWSNSDSLLQCFHSSFGWTEPVAMHENRRSVASHRNHGPLACSGAPRNRNGVSLNVCRRWFAISTVFFCSYSLSLFHVSLLLSSTSTLPYSTNYSWSRSLATIPNTTIRFYITDYRCGSSGLVKFRFSATWFPEFRLVWQNPSQCMKIAVPSHLIATMVPSLDPAPHAIEME
jgi:hypothetical protein